MKKKQKVETTPCTETDVFSALSLFAGLPTSRLREAQAKSEVREVPAGHVFFKTGEGGEGLFLLETGAVQTFRPSGTKRLIVAELKPPTVFGEMGCVGDCRYHCCAQATETTRVWIVPRAELDQLLGQYPIITRRLLDLVSGRFIHVLMDLDATSFRDLIPRMAGLLLERAVEDIVHDMTHEEIAKHLRVYRESATAALGELKKAGIIEVKRKQIRILNRVRLERAARE